MPTEVEVSIALTLQEILTSLKTLQVEHNQLSAAVDAISGKVNVLASVKQAKETPSPESKIRSLNGPVTARKSHSVAPTDTTNASSLREDSPSAAKGGRRSSLASKITLTSYPGQAGVDPITLNWGEPDPIVRGPIIVGRNPNTLRRRNGKTPISWARA